MGLNYVSPLKDRFFSSINIQPAFHIPGFLMRGFEQHLMENSIVEPRLGTWVWKADYALFYAVSHKGLGNHRVLVSAAEGTDNCI